MILKCYKRYDTTRLRDLFSANESVVPVPFLVVQFFFQRFHMCMSIIAVAHKNATIADWLQLTEIVDQSAILSILQLTKTRDLWMQENVIKRAKLVKFLLKYKYLLRWDWYGIRIEHPCNGFRTGWRCEWTCNSSIIKTQIKSSFHLLVKVKYLSACIC